MGLISRQGSAPLETGDTVSATELEAELTTLHTLVNGNLDTTNLAAAAGIVNAQIAADTLTTAKMAASAVSKAHVSTSVAMSGNMTSSASLVDFPTLTSATLTPGSTSDMILMFLSGYGVPQVSDGTYTFGFSVGGTDYSTTRILFQYSAVGVGTPFWGFFAIVAPSTSSTIIKPRYLQISGSTAAFLSGARYTFAAVILPIK